MLSQARAISNVVPSRTLDPGPSVLQLPLSRVIFKVFATEFYSLSRHFWENPAHRTHSFYKLVYCLIEYYPYTKISRLKHINSPKGIERRIWKKKNLWNTAYQRIGRWSRSNKVIQTKHVSHESYVLMVCVKTKVTWSRAPRDYILSDFSMV